MQQFTIQRVIKFDAFVLTPTAHSSGVRTARSQRQGSLRTNGKPERFLYFFSFPSVRKSNQKPIRNGMTQVIITMTAVVPQA